MSKVTEHDALKVLFSVNARRAEEAYNEFLDVEKRNKEKIEKLILRWVFRKKWVQEMQDCGFDLDYTDYCGYTKTVTVKFVGKQGSNRFVADKELIPPKLAEKLSALHNEIEKYRARWSASTRVPTRQKEAQQIIRKQIRKKAHKSDREAAIQIAGRMFEAEAEERAAAKS